GLVAELDRPSQALLDDRAGVRIVQRHDPGSPSWGVAGEALAKLLDDLGGALGKTFEPVDLGDRTTRRPLRGSQLAAGVDHDTFGLTHRGPGDLGHLGVDPAHLSELVVGAAPQVGVDRPGTALDAAGLV